MRESGKGMDWADQWDPNFDDAKATSNMTQKTGAKSTGKEKIAKAKAAASVGMHKTKVYASMGIQKTKVVAIVGAQKVRVGATTGFKWVKAKVQKKPQ